MTRGSGGTFPEQASAKEAGDFEAMHYDADYIRALEYGLLRLRVRHRHRPSGDAFYRYPSIRDVILFPQLRRED